MENKPRYAIVRVDNNCPFMQEKLDFSSCSKMFNCDKFIRCEKCEHNCRYGDTKEQLIKKVAQILIKDEMKICQYKTKVHKRICWQNNMELATKIIEFLGVEE